MKKPIGKVGLLLGTLMLVGAACPTTTDTTETTSEVPAPGQAGVEEMVVSDSTFTLSEPTEGAELDSGFKIRGEGGTPGEEVYARVELNDGTVKTTANVTVEEDGTFYFSYVAVFGEGGEGVLKVYHQDESENEINLLSIPVTYL